MERLRAYFKESYDELVHHVTWPTLANLQGTTMVVIVASALIALIIFIMDVISKTGLGFIYKL